MVLARYLSKRIVPGLDYGPVGETGGHRRRRRRNPPGIAQAKGPRGLSTLERDRRRQRRHGPPTGLKLSGYRTEGRGCRRIHRPFLFGEFVWRVPAHDFSHYRYYRCRPRPRAPAQRYAHARLDTAGAGQGRELCRNRLGGERPRPAYGVRGGALPQSRRMLEPGHGDLHALGRYLHPRLRFLRGENRASRRS